MRIPISSFMHRQETGWTEPISEEESLPPSKSSQIAEFSVLWIRYADDSDFFRSSQVIAQDDFAYGFVMPSDGRHWQLSPNKSNQKFTAVS